MLFRWIRGCGALSAALEKNRGSGDFRPSAKTPKHLDSEYDLLARSLVEPAVIGR